MSSNKSLSIPVLFERMKERFWVLPTLITILQVCSLPLILSVEQGFLRNEISAKLFTGYSPEAARLILNSICTSVMTVIGVLFSITIVVIQQASTQYSPRVIEIFIRARTSQVVLGIFVGTFVFCILLLRQIPTETPGNHLSIPQAAVSLGVLYALICIGLLVHYVHFIAHSIKSTHIIEAIVRESLHYLTELEDFMCSHEVSDQDPGPCESFEVRAERHGYFQSYLPESLDKVLKGRNARVSFQSMVGDYCYAGDVIAVVLTKKELTDQEKAFVQSAFSNGPERTHAQDVRYGLRQLVDIALRALSPGINDPSTAEEAMNAVGIILDEWTKLPLVNDSVRLKNGTILRLRKVTFSEMLEKAYGQMATFSKDHYFIQKKISSTLARIRKNLHDPEELRELSRFQSFYSGMASHFDEKELFRPLHH